MENTVEIYYLGYMYTGDFRIKMLKRNFTHENCDKNKICLNVKTFLYFCLCMKAQKITLNSGSSVI